MDVEKDVSENVAPLQEYGILSPKTAFLRVIIDILYFASNPLSSSISIENNFSPKH